MSVKLSMHFGDLCKIRVHRERWKEMVFIDCNICIFISRIGRKIITNNLSKCILFKNIFKGQIQNIHNPQ